ncbi:MAG: hypothetical protein A2X46_05100 [Lentisphaerae bacterium GWF2_57_35]|nr:MAG: hypothetical protein A2X46_05100 [Lentisphaerae bacterium GWF2_57_35]
MIFISSDHSILPAWRDKNIFIDFKVQAVGISADAFVLKIGHQTPLTSRAGNGIPWDLRMLTQKRFNIVQMPARDSVKHQDNSVKIEYGSVSDQKIHAQFEAI